ncbi:MAG: LamG-like jellyroll fold domain-containing protein [Verrucomicrobiota bacterium JB025]|nr:LamG-like jellyroll fold domain-containing protein [Verrucomicrobiota bacterium JB025]
MKTTTLTALSLLGGISLATGQTLLINQTSKPSSSERIAYTSYYGQFAYAYHNDSGGEGKTTLGNSFMMPDTEDDNVGYEATSISFKSLVSQSFEAGDQLQLWIFEWTPSTNSSDTSSWMASGTNGTSDGDPLSGTGMTPMLTASLPLEGLTFSPNKYFTVDFSSNPLYFEENKAYGFLVGYVDGADDAGSYFNIAQGNGSSNDANAEGIYIETKTDTTLAVPVSTNTVYDGGLTDRVWFSLNGAISDGTMWDPTIEVDDDMIDIGDSVEFEITFDPRADSATLSTPDGAIDLMALDDGATNGDDIAGDGKVVYDYAPTVSHTYEVLAVRAGFVDESASVRVLVADPSNEAADNAFSLALKADSPLFYYRFEDGEDPEFIYDSSGNGWHTNDFVGGLTFGSSPGGMQGACQFDEGSIKSNASSYLDDSFTTTAVVYFEDFSAGTQAIFSMADQYSFRPGRSVFYTSGGLFQSYIDGTTNPSSGTSLLTDTTSYLVHLVYDSSVPEVRFYVNGVLHGTDPVGDVDSTKGRWMIGSNKTRNGQFFSGWIDETAVFTSALTEEQIAAHSAAFTAAADPLLGFTSSASYVLVGDDVTFTWTISDQATAVTINGVPQTISGAGTYTTTMPFTEETTYEIVVTGNDSSYSASILVGVKVPAVVPKITSISVQTSATKDPVVTLELQATPNTTYAVKASADMQPDSTGKVFPYHLALITTDATGYATTTFDGYGDAEFYRIELP